MKKHLFLFVFALTSLLSIGQNKVVLSGYVKDKETGEELIGAVVVDLTSKQGAPTNAYGFYSLRVTPGKLKIRISSVGYQADTLEFSVSSNSSKNFELQKASLATKQVTISEVAVDRNVTSTQTGVQELDIQAVKKVPALLGEVDVIRAIQLLPGVNTVGEGATGFNVRGGNIDQNLILLDEAQVYSSSHLFGFFSIFNPDAIKDTKLIKGGIPAEYGGRLSSVLDVRQRDGNKKKFGATGGLGIISSRLTLEGPIIKDKASFLIAGRRSYADLFFPLFPKSSGLNDSKFNFYDLNAKVNYTISSKDRLFLSAYLGQDNFKLADLFFFNWGNKTATARWNHIFNNKMFSNFSMIYSNYNYQLGSDFFKWTAVIQNYNLKADFNYDLNSNNRLSFGVQGVFYNIQPGKVTDNQFGPDQFLSLKKGIEHAVYISNEQKINKKLSIHYGLRASGFATLGGRTIQLYSDPSNPTAATQTGTQTYANGEVMSYYGGLEPRLSGTYLLKKDASIKFGYNRMRQYIHLISNTSAAVPTDVYSTVDKYIKPTIADQVSVGYFRNFLNNELEFSVESFYKTYQDLVDFKDGAVLIGQENLETEILRGKGYSYGAELYLRKSKGVLNGWISYTYSRTLRQIAGINQGNWYASNYDKPHNLSIVANYTPNKKWEFSAVFNYSTGRPVTLPNGVFQYNGWMVPAYGYRNNGRIPDYHRMDVSINYTPKADKPNKKYQCSWNFSVYNVYARRNAYSVFFRQNATTGQTEAVRLSIFGSVIPSITYNFKF